MTTRRLLILTAASVLALGALSGCAAPFRADVARFHAQLPPPEQGQSFTVMPDNPRLAGSLEFDHYADLVAQHLARYGYVRSSDPAAAKLVVRLQYHVDKGVQRVRVSNWGRSGFYDPFYYGGWGGGWGWGWGRPYMMGYYDPFLFGPSYTDVDSYLVYHSRLRLRIDKANGQIGRAACRERV